MRTLHRAARLAPFVVACVGAAASARAQPCHGRLHAADAVRCALAASPELRAARAQQAAVAARRIGAGLVLPSNPIVSAQLEGAVRPGPNAAVATPAVEWQVTLAQTIELAGQRGRRLAVNDAEADAARRRRLAVAQEVAAASLHAFYESAAARANVALAEELGAAVEALARFAEERARESLLAPVDAHLVRAEAVRVGALRAEAERRAAVARARLALAVGSDDADAADESPPVSPLLAAGDAAASSERAATERALIERALAARAELSVAAAERAAAERQAQLWRRERAPDLTLSAFTGTNVLGETIVGGGLSLPLPLPAPLGRTHAAELAESLARRDQAEATLDDVRRRIRLEVAAAVAGERARAATLALYAPSLVAGARADVRALRDGIANRQLSPRDALIAERTLIELLLGESEARLAWAGAVVELRRATGTLVDEAQP